MQLKTFFKYDRVLIGVIMIAMTWIATNNKWHGDHWKKIVQVDGHGYYAYLPAIFIHDDLNFSFYDQVVKDRYDGNSYWFLIGAHDNVINKYYAGTAICMAPAFLVAHNVFSSDQSDGYSKDHLRSVIVSALLFLMIGMIFINKTLKSYGIGKWMRAVCLLGALFGTNAYYYTVNEPSMSHIYTFGLMSMFIYFIRSYFVLPSSRKIIYAALTLGLIVLVRPVNGLCILFIPFLSNDFENFKSTALALLKNWKLLISIPVLSFAVVAIQFIIYKVSTDHFIVYSYGEETFNFASPHYFDFLFSYKKGAFLWAPILLISLLGLITMFKKDKFISISFIVAIGFVVYILSSWWNWWYGGSYGSRVMIDYIPFFIIPLAFGIQHASQKWLRYATLTLTVLATLLVVIQTRQYQKGMIHWENTDSEAYWFCISKIPSTIYWW